MLQRHGYGESANTLAVASLDGGGQGRGKRILCNYVNWQRNMFFSKLNVLFYLFDLYCLLIAAKTME
jgi:hypothetical protein